MYLMTSCVLTILLLETSLCSAGPCTFPDDLRGEWLSSKKGTVTFTPTQIQGYHPCRDPALCPPSLPDRWECWDRLADRYVIRTAPFTDSGSTGRVYSCLYLHRLSSQKYLSYQAPSKLKASPFFDYVTSVSNKGPDLYVRDLCDLRTNPPPVARYNLFVQSGSIHTTRSTCPSEVLGNFQLSGQCDAIMDVCSDRKTVLLTNATCASPLLYSDDGVLSCLHSLASEVATYVTLYNHDISVNNNSNNTVYNHGASVNNNNNTVYTHGASVINNITHRFVCLAITKTNNQTQIHQSPRDCSNLSLTGLSVNRFNLDAVYLCPFSCNFSTDMVGTWLSSRKGQIVISQEFLSGFEPHGDGCANCSSLPTTFECYIQAGSKYLIRSARTDVAGDSVRIYVCLDFTWKSANKMIYYQAHASKDAYLDDYLRVLNAAAPVDSMETMCVNSTTYDPALYSVLLKKGYLHSGASRCPSDLHAVYNSTLGLCDYTLSTCHDEREVQLTRSTCESAFTPDTDGGRFICIFSTRRGGSTFLTVLNRDYREDNSPTVGFSCFTLQKVGQSLLLTRASEGCQEGQNATHVTTGLRYTFHLLDQCPTDDEPLLIIVVVITVLAGVIVLTLVCVLCRKRAIRRRRKEALRKDEENIVDSDDVYEENEGIRRRNERKDENRGFGADKRRWGNVAVLGEDRGRVAGERREELLFEEGFGRRFRRRREEFEESDEKRGADKEENSVTIHEDRLPAGAPSSEDTSSHFRLDPLRSDISGDSRSLARGRRVKAMNNREAAPRLPTSGDDVEDDDSYSSDFSSSMSTDSLSWCSHSLHRKGLPHIDALTQKHELQPVGPCHDAHAARAWALRKNNPGLVQDQASLRKRHDYERRDGRTSLSGVSVRKLVSRKKWTIRASYRRNRETFQQGTQSLREHPGHKLPPPDMRASLKQWRMQKVGVASLAETPFQDEYYSFTSTRDKMAHDGFWDSLCGQVETADDKFGLRKLEDQLREEQVFRAGDEGSRQIRVVPLCAEIKSSIQPQLQGFSSTLPQVTISLAPQNEYGQGLNSFYRSPSQTRAWLGVTNDKQLSASIFSKSPRLLPEGICTTSLDSGSSVGAERGQRSASSSTGLSDSCQERLNEMDGGRRRHGGSDSSREEAANTDKRIKRVSSAVRRLLTERLSSLDDSLHTPAESESPMTLRSGVRSRMPSRRCNHSLERIHRTKGTARLDTGDPWPSSDLAWAYNMPPPVVHLSKKSPTTFATPLGQHPGRYMDDLDLRRLLEEMYRDKKYMDKVINTTAQDKTEVEVLFKLQTGRNYLLQRALFWLERGPLPPRPPATELGLRLQRLNTTLQLRGHQLPPLPGIRNTAGPPHTQQVQQHHPRMDDGDPTDDPVSRDATSSSHERWGPH